MEKIQWNIITWKEDFYSHLNMEDTSDANYVHEKKDCEGFKTKKISNNIKTGMFKAIHYC